MSPRTPLVTASLVAKAGLAVTTALAVGLGGITAGPALADPKPGSTGKVFGPVAPKATATTVKKATSSPAKSGKSTAKTPVLAGWGMGARGDKVLALQQRLVELKYDIDEPDGQFGDQTQQAILAFQKVNNLNRTGRVTDSVLGAIAAATPPEPMIPNGGKDRVEVDIKRQVLFLYLNGELNRILSISSGSGKDFCVTDPETGKTECDKAITPGGSFRIRGRIIGWRESKLGLLYNPLYFNGGIAIHGAPSVPAYPASHGCVRIPMQAAEWFYTVVKDGTPVYVFGADKAPVPLAEKTPPAATNPSSSVPASTVVAPAPTTLPGGTTAGTTTLPATPTTAAPVPTTSGPTTTVVATPLVTTAPTTTPTATPTTVLSTIPVVIPTTPA